MCYLISGLVFLSIFFCFIKHTLSMIIYGKYECIFSTQYDIRGKEEKMICNKWREIKQLNVKNGVVYFKK